MTGPPDGSASLAPRKAISLLREAPDRLELLLRWCPERDASRSVPGGPGSIRDLVATLGTLDRFHYLESAKRIAASEGRPLPPGSDAARACDEDVADCELAELLTRFRHVRAQSADFLDGLPDDAWERAGQDAAGPATLGALVTDWVQHDSAELARLEAMGGF